WHNALCVSSGACCCRRWAVCWQCCSGISAWLMNCVSHWSSITPHSERGLSMRIASPRRASGFTLIEVAIVSAIVLITAIIGIPAINGYVIENKVPKVGQDLQRFVARLKVASQGQGTTPYADVSNAQLVG